jgi:chromosomal replication initiator protein
MATNAAAGRTEWNSGAQAARSIGAQRMGEQTVMGQDGKDGSTREVFQRVRARLRAAVGEDVFNSWFTRLELEEVVEDVVHVSLPTRFLSSWVQSNYGDKMLGAFQSEIPGVGRIHITVRVNGQARPSIQKAEPAPQLSAEPEAIAPVARVTRDPMPAPGAAPRGDALSGSALDPKMTFDSFVTGSSNEMALQVARQVASAVLNNTVSFNPVYLHSSVGLGKSHLLNAIGWAAAAGGEGKNIVYLTADHFMYHFINAVQRQSALGFKEWLRRVDLLLIDDMQFLQGKSATEFGHTLGTLLTGAKQVVCAGDAPPRDLEMLDERVRSRLSGGLVVGINPLDLELRKAIVTRRAEQASARFADAHFTPAVIDYVARVVVSHGRDLDGAVNRLLAANQLTKEPITVPLAERTLADLVRSRDTRRVRIEDILRIVSRHYKVPRNDLLSSRRSRDVVRPRQIAMYLAKALTSRSLPEIGRRFGGRDHTTVLHSVRKVEQMIKDDGDLAQEIELLKRMLEE